VVVSKVEPEYSEQARNARLQGNVLLQLETPVAGNLCKRPGTGRSKGPMVAD
jgi:hypothetical protein